MTRAFPNPQQEPQGNPRGDWGNLRSELMALLDEVETQVANRPAATDPIPRVGDIRQQAPKRETTLPPNPRDSLESAIRQIRSSTAAPRRVAEQQPAPEPPRQSEAAVSAVGIHDRLERLEAELKSSARGTTTNVKEIADQVAQLSHVVEVLAGAVGEAGQVKRLEAQIAGLAKMLADEPQMDIEALSGRLDDLSGTVATLAEMQRDFATRIDGNDVGARLDGLATAIAQIAATQAEAGKPDAGLAQRVDEISASVDKLSELQLRQMQRGDDVDLKQKIDGVGAMIGRLVELQRAQSERIDRIGIPDRLDDVSATVGRLADLQVQVANRLEGRKDTPLKDSIAKLGTDLGTEIGSLEQTFRDAIANLDSGIKETAVGIDGGLKGGLTGIEESVRSIYDRIDAIEKSVAMTPAEVEKLTEELAAITSALGDPKAPKALVSLVESLNQRIASADGRNEDVGKLKAEIEGLRKAVIGAIEPRFASLEQQLETLSDSVLSRLQDPGIGNVEAQVRQLVARMDQTGEQLSGLARLYQQPAEAQMPDLSDLAELVAQRTSDALARLDASKTVTVPTIDEAGFAEIERRVERVVKAAVEDNPSDDFTALQSTIREVNDRLARLETSLQEEARSAAAPAQWSAQPSMASFAAAIDAPVAETEAPAAAADEPAVDLIASLLSDEGSISVPPAKPLRETGRDVMPADPSVDAPLTDKPFPEPDLESAARQAPRKRHPGLDADQPVMGKPVSPRFDPNRAERPPQPRSSLDASEAAGKEPTASRNTFIEAHRRAARRSSPSVSAPVGGQNSLIGRALSRFGSGNAKAEVPPAAEPEEEIAPAPMARKAAKPLTKGEKLGKPKVRRLADEKDWPEVVASDAEATIASLDSLEPMIAEDGPREMPRESFLVRHRKPILLGLAIIAIACLTINFLAQRLSEHDQAPAKPPVAPATAPAPAAVTTGDATLSPQPMAQQGIDPVTTAGAQSPRVIPTNASLSTGAIDPAAAKSFTPVDQPVIPPTALEPQADAAPAPAGAAAPPAALAMVDPAQATPAAAATDALASPLKVEMPPDGIGPQPLREAAANGDARAQFEIAAIYTEGRAVPQDMKAAAIWYERAAAQGFAPAQYRLGSLYESGQGVDKDLDSARLWYQRAAEAGNRMAMHNLAALYAGGGLGKQEFDTAAKWFGEAADRGLKDSEFNLGMLYARGLGVTQDLAQSYKWFSLAALRGDADAAKARDDIGASLDAATVAKVKAEVASWKPIAIDLLANFAPIGTWSKTFDPGETISKPEVVKSVQAALVQLGYDVGNPDGVMGPKTADAIRDFEQKTGMSQSGAINPRLLAVLGSQPV